MRNAWITKLNPNAQQGDEPERASPARLSLTLGIQMRKASFFILSIILITSCNSRGTVTIDDEISKHGNHYIVEFSGYNTERKRNEMMLTWYKRGIGTHIVQAYQLDDSWIVFQINDEKEKSKW